MLCQNCGKNEVNFKYTQVVNGVKKEMALCEKCAKELGLENMDFNIPINFSSFLGDFFGDYDENFLPSFTQSNALKCTNCGMTYDEFVDKGKFGCENCYNVFENRIDPVLKNIHGCNQHVGRNSKFINKASENHSKTEENTMQNDEQHSKLKKLNEDLKQAIKEEKYEEAAKIRDEIKKINDIKNSIMICENLIKTKGFENVIIFVNGESISVIVGIEELKQEEVAQIQNIVARELNCKVENIHISTK